MRAKKHLQEEVYSSPLTTKTQINFQPHLISKTVLFEQKGKKMCSSLSFSWMHSKLTAK